MKDEIVKLIAKVTGLNVGDVGNLIEVPPKEEMGDFAFPCFGLASRMEKNPLVIAKELVKKFGKGLPKGIGKVSSNGAYVNFFVDKKVLAERVLVGGGKIRKRKGGKVMIEFSQANTHKAFHIGHIRGTSIGESLARISEAVGDKVVRANYQGDTGMHVAKWIWCYNKYHKKEKLRGDEGWVAGVYVDAVKRLGANDKFQEEVDEINRKLDSKEDKALNDLWKKTQKLSLDALEVVYRDLNTRFDKYYFESEFEGAAKKVVAGLVKKGIAKVDDGATIIDFDGKLNVWVLLRGDGTVLYSGKDIALAQEKFKDFDLGRSVYVIADAQNLHFVQLVETLRLMGFKDAGKMKHRAYGLVRLPSGKMSSRTGNNILYSDFKKEIVTLAMEGLRSRESEVRGRELEDRALKIAIAAIKYSMLKQDMNKTIVFDKKEALRFEGDTGPYLLYSYARAASLLRKRRGRGPWAVGRGLDVSEVRLLKKIDGLGDVVVRAYESLAPNLIANYCFELAQIFNEFYHSCPVIGSDEEGFRLKLVDVFKGTLKKGLDLLGIETLEEM